MGGYALGPGASVTFPAPKYAGTFKTRLRFRLDVGSLRAVISNEFDGSINPEQFDHLEPSAESDPMGFYADEHLGDLYTENTKRAERDNEMRAQSLLHLEESMALGARQFEAGEWEAAIAAYQDALERMNWMPEPDEWLEDQAKARRGIEDARSRMKK